VYPEDLPLEYRAGRVVDLDKPVPCYAQIFICMDSPYRGGELPTTLIMGSAGPVRFPVPPWLHEQPEQPEEITLASPLDSVLENALQTEDLVWLRRTLGSAKPELLLAQYQGPGARIKGGVATRLQVSIYSPDYHGEPTLETVGIETTNAGLVLGLLATWAGNDDTVRFTQAG
jgi:hypothetical protein